jgi:hypothetical protein
MTIEGDGQTTIKQFTKGQNHFNVSVTGVVFDSLIITGVEDGTPGDPTATNIYFQGTKASQLATATVNNCKFSSVGYAIFAPWVQNLTAKNNTFANVFVGVFGGINPWVAGDQNSTAALNVDISHNYIVCGIGTQTYSRPIKLSNYVGHGVVSDNYCRGGGMAIEVNPADSTTVPATCSLKITDNDCDTCISAAAALIAKNTIDLTLAPGSRGLQTSFGTAIEVLANYVTISENIIKNMPEGVHVWGTHCKVVGNTFYKCGYQAAWDAWYVSQGVITPAPITDADTYFYLLIDGNTFIQTQNKDAGSSTYITDIYIKSAAFTYSGITISNNMSYGASLESIALDTICTNMTVTGNYIKDAATLLTGSNGYGVRSISSSNSITISDNTFVNTVVGGYGMYYGIYPQAGDIVGFNKFIGMRNASVPLNATNAYKIQCSQMMDGAFYNPKHSTVTLNANATTTTVNNQWVTATSQIRLTPMTDTAAADVGSATSVWISARTAGTSFVITHPNTAGTDKTFAYEIVD